MRGLPGDGGYSMSRYADELGAALRSNATTGLQFQEHAPTRRSFSKIPGMSRFSSALSRYVLYPWQARNLSADLFHIVDHSYSQLLLGIDPSKTIVTCHDVIALLSYFGKIPAVSSVHVAWTIKIRMWLMRRAAYVVTDSENTRRDLIELLSFNPDRVVTIHLGVSDRFESAPDLEAPNQIRDRLGIPRDAKVVLNVSGQSLYKKYFQYFASCMWS
jgi:hypothetical protein